MTRLMVGLSTNGVMKVVSGCLLVTGVGLLTACTSPFVDVTVKVDSCPPTGTRVITTGSNDENVGNCNLGSLISNGTHADNIPGWGAAWHVTLMRNITSADGLSCSSGSAMKKCLSPTSPGSCNGANCKVKYYPNTSPANTGWCNCMCP